MVKFNSKELKLVGKEINVGDEAPEVTVVSSNLEDKIVGGKGDRTQLLVVVPSLDTDVCAKETREFNLRVSSLDIVETTVISMDLPFASKRFCTTEGIDNVTVASDYVNKDFANAYGLLIENSALKGLLARAIFVINEEGVVTYREVVKNITDEPNYEEALEAVKDA